MQVIGGAIDMDDDIKICVLYDRPCIECGECDMCDLNPEKVCDNCMRCIKGEADYIAVSIDEIQGQEDNKQN